jgi:DNA-binding CsgD family transcriptional regulator
MKNWQEELLLITDRIGCQREVFGKIESAAKALGFDYCAYGLRVPVPISNPKTVLLSNYSAIWQSRYKAARYLLTDPTVIHGRKSQTPLVWSDAVFSAARFFWDEARSFGLNFGWAQSSLDAVGVGGMLTLARSHEVLTKQELYSKEIKMRWLVSVAHLTLSRIIIAEMSKSLKSHLTAREVEVLKWTADGKTTGEISNILIVSDNTVNFHIKNAVAKLQAANKTAAVVRAAVLGLLN